MKKLNLIIMAAIALTTIALISCTKNNESVPYTTTLDELTGTYFGNFVPTSGDGASALGKVIVEIIDKSELSIHCQAGHIDATFIVNAYENGDSIMVSDTSIDFEDNNHCMQHPGSMMSTDVDNGTDWMYHMEAASDSVDIQFGGFDMMNHTFFCEIPTEDGDNLRFSGSKNR